MRNTLDSTNTVRTSIVISSSPKLHNTRFSPNIYFPMHCDWDGDAEKRLDLVKGWHPSSALQYTLQLFEPTLGKDNLQFSMYTCPLDYDCVNWSICWIQQLEYNLLNKHNLARLTFIFSMFANIFSSLSESKVCLGFKHGWPDLRLSMDRISLCISQMVFSTVFLKCVSQMFLQLCFQVGLTSASPWTNTTLRSLRGENCSRSYHSPFYLFLSIIIVIVSIIVIIIMIFLNKTSDNNGFQGDFFFFLSNFFSW